MRFSDSDILRDIFLYEWASIEEALAYFKKVPYNSLPVIGHSNRFVGIITLRGIVFNQPLSHCALVADYATNSRILKPHDNPSEFTWPDNMDILPLVDDANKYIGFITAKTFYDILYDENKPLFNEYNQVINSTYNGIVVINTAGKIIVYNSAAERILAQNRSNVLGKHISSLDPAMGLLETLVTGKPAIGVKVKLNGYVIFTNRRR